MYQIYFHLDVVLGTFGPSQSHICECETLWVLRTFGLSLCHISGGLKYIFNFIRCWVLQDNQLMVSNPIMRSIWARDLRPLAVSHFWWLKLYFYQIIFSMWWPTHLSRCPDSECFHFYIILSPWVFHNIELVTYMAA